MKSQLILIVGVTMLLAQVSLNVNGSALSSKDLSYENEAVIAAGTIAQSMIREVTAKKFDQKVITKGVTSPDSLTLPTLLGPETGETQTTFNDVDDYNGLVRVVNNGRLGNFTATVYVNYTTHALLGAPSSTPTFLKRVRVVVSGNRYLLNSVSLSSIVSY